MPGRDQVDGKAALLVDDGVPGIGAAVAADDQVRVARQQVDDLAFALVAPMAADDGRDRHAPDGSSLLEKDGPVAVVLGVVRLVALARFDRSPPLGPLQVPAHRRVERVPELPLRPPPERQQLRRIDPIPPIVRRPIDHELE